MDSHIDYDDGMEQQPANEQTGQPVANVIRDSIRDFVATLGESSRQLASAAEKFAGESLQLIDDATTRAQASASSSSQMAAAAGQAAQEARQVAEGVKHSIMEAGEKVRQEAQHLFEQAGAQSAQTHEAANQLRGEIESRLQDVLQRVESSIRTSQEAADVARGAAGESTRNNEWLQSEVHRLEAAYDSSQATLAAAQRAADEASQTSQYLAAEVKRLDESLQRIESSTAANQESVAALERRVNENSETTRTMADDIQRLDQSVQRVEAAYASNLEAIAGAQRAAEEAAASGRTMSADVLRIDAALSRLEASMALTHETSLAGQKAAEEAREAASEARTLASSMTGSGFGSSAHELLERLEADYQLLTRLVQELHSRITGLSGRAVAPPMPEPQRLYEPEAAIEQAPEVSTEIEEPAAETAAPASWPTAQEPESSESTETEETGASSEETSQPRVWQAWPERGSNEAPVEPEAEPVLEPVASLESDTSASSEATLAGRIMVQVSPVPDFDRLLTLDGALGRMPEIRNVTLADYAKEEVTFRVELDDALTATDFTRKLGESSGSHMELISAAADSIALRLVA